MRKLLTSLTLLILPTLAGAVFALSVPYVCFILFLLNPFLVLLCVGPFAGLLPPDFETFL
jgi:hypothetical protein